MVFTEIIIVLLLNLAAYSTGDLILKFLGIKTDKFNQVLFSMGIGFGFIILALHVLGFLKLYYSSVLLGFLAVLLLPLLAKIRKFRLPAGKFPRITVRNTLWAMLIVLFAVQFMLAFVPLHEIDSLGYHIAVPKNYMRHHSLYELPPISQNHYSSHGMEMLYLYDAAFSQGQVAQLIGLSFSILLTLLIYGLAAKYFSKNIGIFSALLFFTIPIINQFAATPKNDIAGAFYSTLVIASLMLFLKNKGWNYLALVGIFGGMSYMIKLPTMGVVLAAVLIIAYVYRGDKIGMLKKLAFVGMISLIVVSPQLIRNQIIIENPFFPAFIGIKSQYWTDTQIENIDFIKNQYGEKSLYGLVKFPVAILAKPESYGEFLGLSPLFLGIIPLIFLIKRGRFINILLVASAVQFVLWFTSLQTIRFLFPVFPLMTIAAGTTIAAIAGKSKAKMWVIIMPVLFLFLINGALIAGTHSYKIPVLLGLEDQEQFYAKLKNNNPYAAETFLNENYPDGAVMLYGRDSNQAGYLNMDYYYAGPFGQNYISYDSYDEPAQLRERLDELGICCIMTTDQLYRPDHPIWEHANRLVDGVLEDAVLVYNESVFLIYELSE